MITPAAIQTIWVDLSGKLYALKQSLQREFEYMTQTNQGDKVLAAKKRQIDELENVLAQDETFFNGLTGLIGQEYKLRACLLFHGVSPKEVDRFEYSS